MITANLSSSATSTTATSTWTGNYVIGGTVEYTTPTIGTGDVTFTVPASLTGATFYSTRLTYNTSGPSGSRNKYFVDTGDTASNEYILERLQNGATSFKIRFIYRAVASGGVGAHSATAVWSNISISVDYVSATGVSGNIVIQGVANCSYSFDGMSIAPNETDNLTVSVNALVGLSSVSVRIKAKDKTQSVVYSTQKTIPSGSSSNFLYVISLPNEVIEGLTSRVTQGQIQITVTDANGNSTSSSWTDISSTDGSTTKAYKIVSERNEPTISNVQISESGSTHISKFGSVVQGKTIPVINFSVSLDTSADSTISVGSRTITVNGTSYSTGTNSVTITPINDSGSINYSIVVTDSYNQQGTYSGTINVLSYTPPTLTNVSIDRYSMTPDDDYELDDEGVNVWFNGSITAQTTIGTGSNPWSLIITPEGDAPITAVNQSTSTSVTYTENRTFITATYSTASGKTFSVAVVDYFTSVLDPDVSIPKAGGYFNIEKTGVAIGKRSEGTISEPLFESNYKSKFFKDVYFAGNLYDSSGKKIGDPVYSTTPTPCGTWIDGKTIYRVVLTNVSMQYGTTYYDLDFTVAQPINMYGFMKAGAEWHPINSYYNDSHRCYIRFSTSAKLVFVGGGAMTDGVIVIEYIPTSN